MYTKTVRLPYTLWYDGHDKIFRMDMSTILPEEHYEDGKKYVGKIRNVQIGGYNIDGDIQPPPDGNHSYLEVTEAASDREKAGQLFQKLLDAETLNVVEKTDGYELSYTGDVNKVLVKIPKQAITVSQEVITAALTENVVTETIKPTLDKSYYSKEEVDNLIKKLKEELTAEDHDAYSAEEHPQQ